MKANERRPVGRLSTTRALRPYTRGTQTTRNDFGSAIPSIPHDLRWVLNDGIYDFDPGFTLTCVLCLRKWGGPSWSWIGNDGPPLGDVLKALHRAKQEHPAVDEICPATVRGAQAAEPSTASEGSDG